MDWTTIAMVVVVIAALYFLMIRPQQKRAKQQKEHMASLQPGSRVMTVHGIFGTIIHLGEKQAILEVSPGVELTVLKAAISNQPVEDEFEYDDAEPAFVPEPAAVAPSVVPAAIGAGTAAAVVSQPTVAAPEEAPAASADADDDEEDDGEDEAAAPVADDEDEDEADDAAPEDAEPAASNEKPAEFPTELGAVGADAANAAPSTAFPDFADDESFSTWWDEHFPKN